MTFKRVGFCLNENWILTEVKSSTAVRISLKHVQYQLPKLFGSHSCKGILWWWCVWVRARACVSPTAASGGRLLLQNTAL